MGSPEGADLLSFCQEPGDGGEIQGGVTQGHGWEGQTQKGS